MALNQFQYQRLEHLESFRLLFLEPSLEHDADLKGSLYHATLSDCDYDLVEPYTALSYVWGNASHKGTIFLEGFRKDITVSLDAALRDMRDQHRVRRIWADALCIDQSSTLEKNVQVALMGKIYSTAHHTVIHLGDSPPGFETLFNSLKAQSRSKTQSDILDISQLSLAADEIDSMRESLLARSWFRRVWVFQELVLSTDAWVQCGLLRIRWHQFCEAVGTKDVVDAMLLTSLSDSGAGLHVSEGSAGPLENMNSKRYGAFEASLSTLLQCRRGIGATDPRDIIFGHFGVISDRERCEKFIKVDYGRDLAHLSVDVARYFLDATNIENLLSQAMNSSPITTPEIPSWCPRWGSAQLLWEPIHRRGERSGGGDDSSYVSFAGTHHVLLPDPPLLNISGFQLTRIKVTSPTFVGDNEELGGLEQSSNYALEMLEDIRSLLQEHSIVVPLYQPTEIEGTIQTHQAFRESFKDWAHMANAGKFNTAGSRDVDCIAEALLSHVKEPKRSPLAEKRLAITAHGHCALVPAETEPDDIVAMFADCYKYAVLRPEETNKFDHLNNSITSAIEQANISRCPKGPITARVRPVDDNDYDEWELQWEEAAQPFPILHCSIVGQCYIDEWVPWKRGFPRFGFKVFSLH